MNPSCQNGTHVAWVALEVAPNRTTLPPRQLWRGHCSACNRDDYMHVYPTREVVKLRRELEEVKRALAAVEEHVATLAVQTDTTL